MAKESVVLEQLDINGAGTGVESENPDSNDEKIAVPFDPEDIDVVTRTMTVDLLLSRTQSKMINLQPDFQRRWGVWDEKRQSRLIESLLLRIPLPVLYAAEDDDESWEIVDGIQRLSTIARFLRPEIISSEPLVLSNLEYLSAYNGKRFSGLSARMQLRLRETELVIHLIRKGTPAEVKFNVFARINTGGVALSAQELRHAITPGRARTVLEQWAGSKEFLAATGAGIKTIRMDDREVVLRFIAFYELGLSAYKQPNMDAFLILAMKTVNELSEKKLSELKDAFLAAMKSANAIFGNDAFRKRYNPQAGRLPINKALFEAVSVNLAKLSSNERAVLLNNKSAIKNGIIELCNDRNFETSISQGTGDVTKVKYRFRQIETMFKRILSHD